MTALRAPGGTCELKRRQRRAAYWASAAGLGSCCIYHVRRLQSSGHAPYKVCGIETQCRIRVPFCRPFHPRCCYATGCPKRLVCVAPEHMQQAARPLPAAHPPLPCLQPLFLEQQAQQAGTDTEGEVSISIAVDCGSAGWKACSFCFFSCLCSPAKTPVEDWRERGDGVQACVVVQGGRDGCPYGFLVSRVQTCTGIAS